MRVTEHQEWADALPTCLKVRWLSKGDVAEKAITRQPLILQRRLIVNFLLSTERRLPEPVSGGTAVHALFVNWNIVWDQQVAVPNECL